MRTAFNLYVNSELIGTYQTRHLAGQAAFEIMLDGGKWNFEIVEIPAIPENQKNL